MSRFRSSRPSPRGTLSGSSAGVASPPPKTALRPFVTTPAITIPAHQPAPVQTPRRLGGADALRQSELDNPLRKLGLYFAIAFIFCRFSLFGEVVSNTFNFDPHVARILGIPTIILALTTGGLWRVLRSRLTLVWLGLVVWMMMSAPVSFWPGGSASLILNYVRGQLPMLLIAGGLILTWKECRLVLLAMAAASVVNVMSGKLFAVNADSGTRLNLELGTIGNANDFTAHLFFVLPFVIFVMLISERGWIRRILCLGVLAYGLYFCATTGSRGGLVAFAAVCAFILIRAPGRVRIGALAAAVALFFLMVTVLPQSMLHRYATLFSDDSNDQEAVQSTAARTSLLRYSIQFTLQHPFLGVGPGEFSDYQASVAKSAGKKGAWQVTHNAYTEVSSEIGIPGLLLYLAAIVMSFRAFGRAYRVARHHPQLRSMAMACFCCQMSIVGFCTATIFLSLAFTMYLPTISGLALAISRSLHRELGQIQPRTQ